MRKLRSTTATLDDQSHGVGHGHGHFPRTTTAPPSAHAQQLLDDALRRDATDARRLSWASASASASSSSMAHSPVHVQSCKNGPHKSKNLFARLFRMRTKSSSHRDVEAPVDDSSSSSSHHASAWNRSRGAGGSSSHDHYAAVPQVVRSTSAPVPHGATKVLMDGPLTKLTTHKYWHSKPSYFVLEEMYEAAAGTTIYLRQYRKRDEAVARQLHQVLCEIMLSEDDVVVDISDKYVKFGLELAFTACANVPRQSAYPTSGSHSSSSGTQSLRLSAHDSASHEMWMHALGSAIAKLIVQAEKHYPIRSPPQSTVYDTLAMASLMDALPPVDRMSNAGIPTFQTAKVLPYRSSLLEDPETENKTILPATPVEEDRYGRRRCSATSRWGHEDDSCTSYCSCGSAGSDHGGNNQDENEYTEMQRRRSYDRLLSDPAVLSPTNESLGGSKAASLFDTSPNAPVPRVLSPNDDNQQDEWSRSSQAAFSRTKYSRTAGSPFFPVVRPQVHTFNANGQVFTLDVRYRLLKSIGTGAYGAVIAVKDSVRDSSVAIKKITNIFDDLVDAKRILREVRLLGHFRHKNITRLLDLAPPPSRKQFDDMYIITELMETDLHQVIYSMQPMSDDHVKYFLYQMLCALNHIHSAGVLHRDMKPSNILLNSNCDLKVCDFGLARGGLESPDHKPLELTEYVVTRWYRAPEIMLNCLQYTAAIDVWAVGCIFAEMLLREPLFPGNDYIHQLKLIIKFLGTPKQEDIDFVKNVKALRFLTKLSISKPKKWKEVFTGDDLNPLAIDLLSQMLIFNPEKRISVNAALQHPYLATFYDPADIVESPEFDFSFDIPDEQLTKDALIDLLYEDIEHFHPIASFAPSKRVAVPGGRFLGLGMTASAS
ncbi:TPA: hypothetical protein N0F65_005876 [Lagenidium giganteum]|uniref:Mitogen-activated protein kinase n=1 Tax=Lagenidium giganteum TaxID=4803 RepID=A0AAV2YNK3_9STRA|nr:TPA: hypothetical protein N0F65_005876 [Lagenidium giganteum]